MSAHYAVNECFLSPQGEGHRVGLVNVFLRFQACNLQCVDGASLGRPLRGNEVDTGWNCDTAFARGEKLTFAEVFALIRKTDTANCKRIIFTGGEPSLQLDDELVALLKSQGYFLAIETNGTRKLPAGLDWISCSPKPERKPEIIWADEVRCVVRVGQAPDPQGIKATHYFVSPACHAPSAEQIERWHSSALDFDPPAMAWAVKWCLENPEWRVSLQTHKLLGVR